MSFQIERRQNLSYEEFASEYLFANKPVIVTDALRGRKALSWTPQFFKSKFGDMTITIDDSYNSAPAEGADGRKKASYTMAEFIDAVLNSDDDNPAPYFRNRVLSSVFPSLQNDIQPLPQYLFPNWLLDRYLLKTLQKKLNRDALVELYIGGRGGTFPVLHYDVHMTHAFLMQLYGRKLYTFYSPDQSAYLYPSQAKPNHAQIKNIEKPDLEKFPLFAKAVPSQCVLEAGEMLFIAGGWWHTVKMLSPSITLSANVVNQSNWQHLVNHVSGRFANPVASAAGRGYLTAVGAWRSWRDRGWTSRVQTHQRAAKQ